MESAVEESKLDTEITKDVSVSPGRPGQIIIGMQSFHNYNNYRHCEELHMRSSSEHTHIHISRVKHFLCAIIIKTIRILCDYTYVAGDEVWYEICRHKPDDLLPNTLPCNIITRKGLLYPIVTLTT